MLKAINIKWDTDGDMEVLNELPTELIIPDDLEELYKRKEDREYALEEIADWLSEDTGFCHDGFKIEKVITKEFVEIYMIFSVTKWKLVMHLKLKELVVILICMSQETTELLLIV